MKNGLFILVCLFTSQAFGQQTMKAGNQGKHQQADAAAGLAEAPKVVISSSTCPVEGYTITLTRDPGTGSGVSEKRYISVDGIRNTFYATAAQVSALPNFSGLPAPGGNPIVHNTGSGPYLSVSYVNDIDPLKKYCDKNGFRLIQDGSPIYKVSMGSNHQQWSGSVTITSGSNLDGAYTWFLVKTYNDKRGFTGTERVPQSCVNACKTAGGGVESTPPDISPFSYVDASGQVYDWFNDSTGGSSGSGIGGGKVIYERLSLIAGIASNSFGDNIGYIGFVNQSYGAHLGLYVPVTFNNPVTLGVYVSGDYLMSNKDGFRHAPDGFEVDGMVSTVKSGIGEKIKQTIMMLGAGPQVNVSVSKKIGISGIVQGGLASFKQSAFSFTQVFEEGDERIPVEIFNQKETKSNNFFWTPRLKIGYTLTSKIGIWAERNYVMGYIEANQSKINPGDPTRENGTYSFGQVNAAKHVEGIKKYSLKGPGAAAGIRISLSK